MSFDDAKAHAWSLLHELEPQKYSLGSKEVIMVADFLQSIHAKGFNDGMRNAEDILSKWIKVKISRVLGGRDWNE